MKTALLNQMHSGIPFLLSRPGDLVFATCHRSISNSAYI